MSQQRKLTPWSIANALVVNNFNKSAAAKWLRVGRTQFYFWSAVWKDQIEHYLRPFRTQIADNPGIIDVTPEPKLLQAPKPSVPSWPDRNILNIRQEFLGHPRHNEPPSPHALNLASCFPKPEPKSSQIANSYGSKLGKHRLIPW